MSKIATLKPRIEMIKTSVGSPVAIERLSGFQLRYIYFLDPTAKDRLTVPILPFSEIERRGAGMYKGIKRPKQAMTGDQPEQREGSAHPDAPIIKGGE